MPEKIIGKFKKNIIPQWKICFWSAIIIGLIAHLYKITNWLPNWDSLVFRYDSQNMVSLGRWFLPIVSAPSSFYDLPWLTGLMSIVFHALGAVCIVEIFKVRKTVTACLIGAVVAAFPTVTSVMLYNYVADAYALAFLFACMAVVFITKEKPNYILSVILIILSVGIYQAYITVTITLILCSLIKETLWEESKVKDLLIKCGKYLLVGIIGMAVYYLVLTVILKITGAELLEYQGFDNAATFSSFDILASLFVVKESFLNYFFDFTGGINLFGVLNVFIFAVTLIIYVADIIKNKLKISKILLLCVFVLLLVFGASVLAFVNSSIDYHNLMKMGFVSFYILLVIQYEKTEFSSVKINAAKLWTILVLTALLIFNYIIIANVSYHKLNMAYERSYAVLNRIVDRIEQTDGADECDSILVLGALENSEKYSSNLPPDITGTTDGYILRADDEIVGQSVLCSAINDYCGKDYKFIAGKAKEELLNKIEQNDLGIWPDENSIIKVDNVIVVKLSD